MQGVGSRHLRGACSTGLLYLYALAGFAVLRAETPDVGALAANQGTSRNPVSGCRVIALGRRLPRLHPRLPLS